MPEKIMIVEGEVIVAMVLSLRLRRLGYEVIGKYSTAEETVPACGKTHHDVVVMDFMLKGRLDGLQAPELIHSLYNTPVIMLSAQPESTGPVEPDSYLIKPYELFGK
jgi:CheY-like chemotaxis protein